MLTWSELLKRSPELAGLRADALSIARNAKWDWYPKWLPKSNTLFGAVKDAARRLDVDPRDVHHVAVQELLGTYEAARARRGANPR